MAYFDPSDVEFDTVNIINLKRILELCTVPDVGPSPLDPQLTVEMRCANALTTLEKPDGVFDEALYQDAVFAREVDEDWLDGQLLLRARAKSVPDSHFPALCMKNIPQCPTPMVAAKLSAIPDPSKPKTPKRAVSNNANAAGAKQLTGAKSSQSLAARPPRLSINTTPQPNSRASLSVAISWSKRGRDVRIQRAPSDSGRPQSPSSIFSSFSRLSTTSTVTMRSKARDGFNSFFRREYKPAPPTVRESRVLSPSPTDGDAPSVASACDSSLLSSPSTSLSSRTSTSSFADISLYSWTDSRILQRCSKNPRFIALRLLCVTEAKRFVDFAQHQRVALPLFLGRARMELERRRDTRLEELKKKHDEENDDLENRHLEIELIEMDEHAEQAKDEAVKNATALKYMQARMRLLGDGATAEDRQRLDDEERAMEKLARRQQCEIRNLLRDQYREKLALSKEQARAREELERAVAEEERARAEAQRAELQRDLDRLEELVHVRSLRLTARWHLTLQIFKQEDPDAFSIKAALPLSILGLPEEFTRYVAAYH